MRIAAFIYVANLILFIIVALMESKRPIWALPWLVICAILPFLGPASYFLLTRKTRRTLHELAPARPYSSPDANRAVQTDRIVPTEFGAHSTSCKLKEPKEPEASALSRPIEASLYKLGFRLQRAKVKLMTNGVETFDALIHALTHAESSIDVDFYIYRHDDIGNIITDLLIQKVRAGVQVRFVRDAIGSHAFPKSEVNRMLSEGIECKVFHPVRFPWLSPSLNQRDHGKIVIIDRKEAFIGGANVGNEYTGLDPVKGPWRDTEMHIISDGLNPLVECFEANWREATNEQGKPSNKDMVLKKEQMGELSKVKVYSGTYMEDRARMIKEERSLKGFGADGQNPLPLVRLSMEASSELHPDLAGGSLDSEAKLLNLLRDDEKDFLIKREKVKREDAKREDFKRESASGQFLNTDMQSVYGNPDVRTDAMRELFFLCITEAETSIEITTPYFAPDVDLIMALKVAALRNVRVRVLVPRNPDHKLIGLASRTYYPELLLAGVEIYLHEKGILHAKTMVIDNRISVVGATNFDLRSFHLNREVCEVMYSKKVAERLTAQFEHDLLDATRMTLEDTSSSTIERIKERGARLFVPFL